MSILHLGQAISISFAALGGLILLSYVILRVDLVVEVFVVIPYIDPGVYNVVPPLTIPLIIATREHRW